MLDQRELASRISSIRKAKDANEPASVIITALESLRKEGNPTEEMIRVRALSSCVHLHNPLAD